PYTGCPLPTISKEDTQCPLSHCAPARRVISGLNCKTGKRENRSQRHTSVQNARLQCSPSALNVVFSLSTFRQESILDAQFADWISVKPSPGWFSAFTNRLQALLHLHPNHN